MRRTATLLIGLLTIVSTAYAGVDHPRGGSGRAGTPGLPESLDAFYPPEADRPLYLFRMLALDTPFSGIVVDLMEDDLDGARASFARFHVQYREVAATVPEWKGEYPEKPVEELGAALAAGDKARALSAFAVVGGICHRCHLARMVPVQQKYRWGSMGAITVEDPLSGAATGYVQFKRALAANLAGITVDLGQGQGENARKQFEGFRARFRALTDTCTACHDGKRSRYVDGEVQEALDMIGRGLAGSAPDLDAVTSLARTIGGQSCSKCHLVHVPAALAGTSPR
jgi:cytochrome c556